MKYLIKLNSFYLIKDTVRQIRSVRRIASKTATSNITTCGGDMFFPRSHGLNISINLSSSSPCEGSFCLLNGFGIYRLFGTGSSFSLFIQGLYSRLVTCRQRGVNWAINTVLNNAIKIVPKSMYVSFLDKGSNAQQALLQLWKADMEAVTVNDLERLCFAMQRIPDAMKLVWYCYVGKKLNKFFAKFANKCSRKKEYQLSC